MKATNYLKVLLVLLFVGVFTACVQDDDYDVPNGVGVDSTTGLMPNTTIDVAKAIWSGSGVTEFTGDEKIMTGYVVSSDASGNFYKELYIQDHPTNPTSAIRLALDQTDLYNFYNIGRLVYVKLNGLYIGLGDGDVVTIGAKDGDEITEVNANIIEDHVLRSATVETITGLSVLSLSDINSTHIGMYVSVDDTQVVGAADGSLPFFDAVNDLYDTKRTLEQCTDGSTFILETSAFASFAQISIPQLKGAISGIITQDFGGNNLILALNEASDMVYDDVRCDPIFEENFANLDAWVAYDVLGAQSWYIDTFNPADPVARISGYSGGAQPNEDWLISPAIDLSSVINPILTFENVKRFAGADLEVYMSTDYAGSGDPGLANWTPLVATLDTNTGSWSSWTNSGNIDLSAAVGGNVFIAFKYISDNSDAATWQIDDVKVKEL